MCLPCGRAPSVADRCCGWVFSAHTEPERQNPLNHPPGKNTMNLALTPLISLIAGILILLVPRLLNYIVAIYLIVIGLVGIFGGNFNLRF
jgi:hypothetical protein